MATNEKGGAAFPVQIAEYRVQDGMTLRQYAAIKLRVPDSGTDWLDDMIRASLRNEFASAAVPAAIQNMSDLYVELGEGCAVSLADNAGARIDIATEVFAMADAMLQEGGSSK